MVTYVCFVLLLLPPLPPPPPPLPLALALALTDFSLRIACAADLEHKLPVLVPFRRRGHSLSISLAIHLYVIRALVIVIVWRLLKNAWVMRMR